MVHHPRVATSLILRRTRVILLLTVDIYIYPHYISLYIHILSYIIICYSILSYIVIYYHMCVYSILIMFHVSKMISRYPDIPISPSTSAVGDGTWGLRDLEELKRPMQAIWVFGSSRRSQRTESGRQASKASQELDCDHALNALWSDPSARN